MLAGAGEPELKERSPHGEKISVLSEHDKGLNGQH
jgi:hypothetical protein